MKDEKYNGWTNHETWALNLWLTNDEGTYNETKKILKEAELKDKALKEFVEDLREQAENESATEELKNMFHDVGSLWRVNWQEITDSFKEE